MKTTSHAGRFARFSPYLLAAIHLCLAWLFVSTLPTSQISWNWPYFGHLAFHGLLSGQLALLGIWMGLGPLRSPLKVSLAATAFLVIAACFTVWHWRWFSFFGVGTSAEYFGWFWLMPASAILAYILQVFITTRIAVQRLCLTIRVVPGGGGTYSKRLVRLPLRQLFLLTTLLAAVLALGRSTHSHLLFLGGAISIASGVILLITGVSVVTLVNLWAGLATRGALLRLGAAAGTAVAIGIFAPFVFQLSWREWISFPLAVIIHSAFVVGTLLVLRVSGYRLVQITDRDLVHSSVDAIRANRLVHLGIADVG